DDMNFSLESKDGLIRTITVDMVGQTRFDRNDGKSFVYSPAEQEVFVAAAKVWADKADTAQLGKFLEKLAEDDLKDNCALRYPIARNGGLYFSNNLVLSGNAKKFHKMMLDTGWAQTAINDEICKEIRCKEIDGSSKELGKNVDGTGGIFGFASE